MRIRGIFSEAGASQNGKANMEVSQMEQSLLKPAALSTPEIPSRPVRGLGLLQLEVVGALLESLMMDRSLLLP